MPALATETLDRCQRCLDEAIGHEELSERLALAGTTVDLRLAGAPGEGLSLCLDRHPPAVLGEPAGDAEITLHLTAEQLELFARGELDLHREILSGAIQYEGPVRKLLVVSTVLRAALGHDERSGDRARSSADGFTERAAGDFWAFECHRLTKRFGPAVVLDELELGIPEGLITVLLGPSGTGKSVLIRHLTRLMKPDSGSVLFRGRDLWALTADELVEFRRSCGLLFQDGALWGSMDLFDNVALPLREHTDLPETEIAALVGAQLKEVGLSGVERRRPSELSGGMRKRAGFARALILEPELVFFDEPDSGLDPVRTALLAELVIETHARRGGTYVIVSHDIGLARRLAEYIVVLWGGRVVAAGLAADILSSDDPFVAQFLAGDVAGPLGMD